MACLIYSDYVNQLPIRKHFMFHITKRNEMGSYLWKRNWHFIHLKWKRFLCWWLQMGKKESDASALTVILQRILARQHVTKAENDYKQLTIKWLFTLFGDRIVRLGLKINITFLQNLKWARIYWLRLRHIYVLNKMQWKWCWCCFSLCFFLLLAFICAIPLRYVLNIDDGMK